MSSGGTTPRDTARDEEIALLRREVEALRAAVAELRVEGPPAERRRFEEIDVQRINVVEPDGTLRVAVSNNARFPAPVVEGKAGKRSSQPLAGMIFYNDDGDECGGLYGYGRTAEDGTYTAGGGLNFDQYRPQDQVLGINYHGQDGRNTAGLRVWERVHGTQVQFPDQESIDASLIGRPYATRVFAGRTSDGAAVVRLCDAQGTLRLRLAVAATGTPTLEFFDERGSMICRLPEAPKGHGDAPEDAPGTSSPVS
jgi:hypothetical protein